MPEAKAKRARVVPDGPMAGVLAAGPPTDPCDDCGTPTVHGRHNSRRRCGDCRAKRRAERKTLPPCRVCGKPVCRRYAELGLTRCPTCTAAARRLATGRGTGTNAGQNDRPGLAERIEHLAALYAAVEEMGSESAAIAAGLPTTAGQVPWPGRVTAPITPEEDDDDRE